VARRTPAPLIARLFVLWSEAGETPARHVIGTLWRETDGSYAFAYEPDLDLPKSRGFTLLPEFPEHRTASAPFRSSALFSTFSQRIPSPKRLDFSRMLRSWGVADGSRDPLQILALSGGVQVTDSLELAEYRTREDRLTVPLHFRLAGERFFRGSEKLSPNDRVVLQREPSNPKDPLATLVLEKTGEPVGYVPRQYSALVAQLLDSGSQLDAVAVRRLTLPDDRDRWVVRVQRAQGC